MKVVKTGRICWIPTVIKGILNYKRKDVADFKKRCYILFLNLLHLLGKDGSLLREAATSFS